MITRFFKIILLKILVPVILPFLLLLFWVKTHWQKKLVPFDNKVIMQLFLLFLKKTTNRSMKLIISLPFLGTVTISLMF